jgi:hypothetical protein
LTAIRGVRKLMRPPKQLYTAALFASILFLVSCAHQPISEAYGPPGFFMGVWNGFTIFFALIGHLFDNSIRIYAFPNSGGWYDFGFFLGACIFGGGGGSAASH